MGREICSRLHPAEGLVLAVLLGVRSAWAAPVPVSEVRQAATRAVEFLRQIQQPDGSFLGYRCRDEAMTDCLPSNWIDFTRIVIEELPKVPDADSAVLLEKAAQFLLAQMDEHGFFRTHPKIDSQYSSELARLAQLCPPYWGLEALGISLPPLLPRLLTYQRVDGLFYTSAIPIQEVEAAKTSQEAHDQFVRRYGGSAPLEESTPDPITNAMVFSYLVRHGHVSAALCDYLVRLSQQTPPAGPGGHYEFLTDPISLSYSLGATCLEPAKAVLLPLLLKQQRSDGSWGNSLHTAHVAESLMNFGYTGEAVDRAIRFLLSQQQPDGSWKRVPVYVPSSSYEVREVYKWLGSEGYSTSAALSALGQYVKRPIRTNL